MEEVRARRWVPLAVWGATLLLNVVALVIQLTASTGGESAWGFRGGQGILSLSCATVGAVITSKRRGNPIGRIFVSLGLLSAVIYLCEEYAGYGLSRGQDGLLFQLIVSVQEWAWVGALPPVGLLLLWFPDGKMTTGAERNVARILIASGVGTTLGWALLSPTLQVRSLGSVPNPLAVIDDQAVGDMIAGPLTGVLMLSVLASAVLLAIRFRRSDGVRRQQLRWFVYSAAVAGPILVLSSVIVQISFVAVIGMSLVMVAAGVAVLRYRLYDIDLLVNRALVYGALTALLVGAYLGLVVALQLMLDPLTQDSDLTVAASTLAVAALFRPLRARVQGFIDRRFYRRKYDSTQALAEFGRRLRDEVDLSVLERDVTAVLSDTLQPAHASLWMMNEGAR